MHEIVENKPLFAVNEIVEIFEAVRTPVLSKVVLKIAGTMEVPLALKGTFVSKEPSPICFP